MIKLICAELFGRMCTVELPRWTSVDEMLETILNSLARPESVEDRPHVLVGTHTLSWIHSSA